MRKRVVHTAENNRYLSRRQADYEAMGYPAEVARAQARCDLDALCYRAWVEGASPKGIGRGLNRTGTRILTQAHRHAKRVKRGVPYPVEQWSQPNLLELKAIYDATAAKAQDGQRTENRQAQDQEAADQAWVVLVGDACHHV